VRRQMPNRRRSWKSGATRPFSIKPSVFLVSSQCLLWDAFGVDNVDHPLAASGMNTSRPSLARVGLCAPHATPSAGCGVGGTPEYDVFPRLPVRHQTCECQTEYAYSMQRDGLSVHGLNCNFVVRSRMLVTDSLRHTCPHNWQVRLTVLGTLFAFMTDCSSEAT